jgi:hypothetical protein
MIQGVVGGKYEANHAHHEYWHQDKHEEAESVAEEFHQVFPSDAHTV